MRVVLRDGLKSLGIRIDGDFMADEPQIMLELLTSINQLHTIRKEVQLIQSNTPCKIYELAIVNCSPLILEPSFDKR